MIHFRGLLLCLLLGACAPRAGLPPRPVPESLPAGSPLRSTSLADGDAWLRHHLMTGEYVQAMQILRRSSEAPGDRLLRSLQEASVLHQAGEYARSNAVFERAEVEADRRFTRSLSREAGALLLNDRVLSYTPSAAELVMIPYYRMLNYLALGDLEAAVVESRKANALLDRLPRDPIARCRQDGLVQYLAGVVQRAAGESNDALVSLRRSAQSFEQCGAGSDRMISETVGVDLVRAALDLGLTEVADSAMERYSLEDHVAKGQGGELWVLVEHGFVAHRAEQALHVPIALDQISGLERDDTDGIAEAAALISARLLDDRRERRRWGRADRDPASLQWAATLNGAYVLRLAWPELRQEVLPAAEVRLEVNDSVSTAVPVGDVSAVVREELEEERGGMLTRLVVRGLTKYLLTREAEDRAEEKGGTWAGFLVGRLTNLAVNELERADTRSWTLLPDRVSLLRLQLPTGEHRIELKVTGEKEETRLDLGTIRIRQGEMVLLRQRVWGAGSTEAMPLRSAFTGRAAVWSGEAVESAVAVQP